jgi:multiple sugar transport system ATP-binding protein
MGNLHPAMATVDLKAVSKIYGTTVRAVDSIDLSISDGEFIVLVGPSGCGKSTTLRMIAGLEDLSGGTISIGNRIVNDVPPKDRNIAMVFQNYALYPHLNVRQNLSFGLECRRTFTSRWRSIWDSTYRAQRHAEQLEITARVDTAARTLGIEHLLNRPPRELSGGQRQRVAVGRALVRDPAVFLFDEPLSNLDALLRGELRTELRILHRSLRSTMVYVTHDQEEAMSLADRMVVMKDGVVQQIGSPAEIYETPANRFVAGFIGTPPMNMFEGRLATDSNGRFNFYWKESIFSLCKRWGAGEVSALDHDTVTLGIRPDRLRIIPAGENENSCCLTGHVVTIERYGPVADIIADVNGMRVISRTSTDTLAAICEGDAITLEFQMQFAHFFRADGSAITYPVKSPTH